MAQEVLPNMAMAVCGFSNQKFSPKRNVKRNDVDPMVLNQPKTNKRLADNRSPPPFGISDFPHNIQIQNIKTNASRKKTKLADKIVPKQITDHIPEAKAYMDLVTFERKLDLTIMKKQSNIQEALKRPNRLKRKLRTFISTTFYPAKEPGQNEKGSVASWELKVEGHLLVDDKYEPNQTDSKFSSFLKSLVIELDKDLYGPENNLVQWHRTKTTRETDGFQVKRPGDKNTRCTISLLLNYQPLQFKLDQRLARLLGIHTDTRTAIIDALWQYIKIQKLQDSNANQYINCDKYLEQIFNCSQMKFAEIPQRLMTLLYPPDHIVIDHIINVQGVEQKQLAYYDITVEVNDTLKGQLNNCLFSMATLQEIQSLDNKIHQTVDSIKQLNINREFFLGFAKDPQKFLHKWIISQTNDLKMMTDVIGNPEDERRTAFYHQPWIQEAISRYLYFNIQQK